ncbi:MAG: ABC transporter ATP-binding protein [Aggregatilineales bacterium]
MSDLLQVRDVHKSFERLQAVDGVSLTVPAGKIIGLIGPNGSGKSTLFALLSGSQRADSGAIEFDGHDITRRSPAQIFQLGLVRSYQDPSLFTRMTVLDNVLLPVKNQRGENPLLAPLHRTWHHQEKAIASAVGALLDQVKLRQHYAKLAADLSGGQMKLLELGRSLNGAPRLLLLDEPTAGVAPKLARDIFLQIEALRRSQALTFLIIEHHLDVLFEFADAVYVMHNGRVVAHGKPAEIAANAQVREIYFGD